MQSGRGWWSSLRLGCVAEALAAVREHQPDVVLLDIYMGEDNSLDYLPGLLKAAQPRCWC